MFEHPELLSWEACLHWQGYGVPALPKEDRDVDRSLTIGLPTACTATMKSKLSQFFKTIDLNAQGSVTYSKLMMDSAFP